MTTPLLELRGIKMRYGAVEALRGVNISVQAGEVLALVGDNGAGKSTVAKTVSGVLQPDEGEIRLDGTVVTFPRPHDAAKHGVATVYQDLALCDNLDVVANLFLGQELLHPAPPHPKFLAHLAMRRETERLLSSLSVRLPSPTARVQSLSGGQRQAVAIARALVGEPRLLLLDEPTAALGAAQRREVMDLIRRLRDRGLGIIVITHNLNEVFQVSDRISVMRLGRCVVNAQTTDMTEHQLVAAITGVGETADALDQGQVSA